MHNNENSNLTISNLRKSDNDFLWKFTIILITWNINNDGFIKSHCFIGWKLIWDFN